MFDYLRGGFDRFGCGGVTGSIRIEAQEDPVRMLAQFFGLILRERSSERGYRIFESRLVQRDAVQVPLDDERERYRELSLKIDELATAGQNISTELRGEYDSLVSKLKNKKEVKVK